MGDKKEHNCVCEEAVRYTYHNLRSQNYTQIEALESAYKVLIHHHPEIPKEEIPSKVFSMLVSS